MPSLHRRIVRIVLALTAPVVLALSLAMDLLVSDLAWRQCDDALASRTRDLSTLLEREPERYEFEYDERYVPEYSVGRAAFFEIRKIADNSLVARSTTLGEAALTPSSPGDPPISDVMLPDGRPGRAMTLRFIPRLDEDVSVEDAPKYQDEVVLVVAVETDGVTSELARVRAWLWTLCGLALLVATGAAVFAARSGLRPLQYAAAQLATVDARQLGQRLVLAGVPSELRAPLEQVNGLLERLEQAFAHERRFSGDVSHELRTPMAALRAVLQLALSRPRDAADYKSSITRAAEMVEQIVGIVERLLLLARADAGQVKGRLVEVALRPLVEERWFVLRDRAAARELVLVDELNDDDTVVTDETTLLVVIGNLLDNAVTYTERGGTIRVRRPPGSLLEVWDSGPVPTAEARSRMFDRFWRGDVARSGDGVHVGLGLPLSRAMSRAVGLDLVALAVDGGLGIRICTRGESPST